MRSLFTIGALAAAVIATPAMAVNVTSTSTSGGNVAKEVETSSNQISYDFDIYAFSPITLNFGVQAGDAARYNFDSAVGIFTGVNANAAGVASLVLGLTNGATFDLGAVSPSFSVATTSLNAAGNQVTINFAPAETNGVFLGSLETALGDFGINRNGLGVGQSFALTLNAADVVAAPVPEPATWLTMIVGCGIAGAGLRRTRRSTLATA